MAGQHPFLTCQFALINTSSAWETVKPYEIYWSLRGFRPADLHHVCCQWHNCRIEDASCHVSQVVPCAQSSPSKATLPILSNQHSWRIPNTCDCDISVRPVIQDVAIKSGREIGRSLTLKSPTAKFGNECETEYEAESWGLGTVPGRIHQGSIKSLGTRPQPSYLKRGSGEVLPRHPALSTEKQSEIIR